MLILWTASTVPHLLWETHKLDVEDGKLSLSMDQLRDDFDSINIQVALACDGNWCKELNMISYPKASVGVLALSAMPTGNDHLYEIFSMK